MSDHAASPKHRLPLVTTNRYPTRDANKVILEAEKYISHFR